MKGSEAEKILENQIVFIKSIDRWDGITIVLNGEEYTFEVDWDCEDDD